MSNENRFGWLRGFLIGGTVGALTAILTAPRSGEKTRAMIRAKGEEIRDGAMQTFDDGRERLAEIASETRMRVKNLRNVGEDVLADQKEVMTRGAKKVRKAVHDNAPSAA